MPQSCHGSVSTALFCSVRGRRDGDVLEIGCAIFVCLADERIEEGYSNQRQLQTTGNRTSEMDVMRVLCRLATLASPSGPPKPEFESLALSDSVGQPVSAMYDWGLLGAVAATD